MAFEPIKPSPYPIFMAACHRCGDVCESTNLAADTSAAPGAYLCWRCQSADLREAVRRACNAGFNELSPEAKRAVRVQLFGVRQTEEIEAQALIGRDRWRS